MDSVWCRCQNFDWSTFNPFHSINNRFIWIKNWKLCVWVIHHSCSCSLPHPCKQSIIISYKSTLCQVRCFCVIPWRSEAFQRHFLCVKINAVIKMSRLVFNWCATALTRRPQNYNLLQTFWRYAWAFDGQIYFLFRLNNFTFIFAHLKKYLNLNSKQPKKI